MSDKPRTKRQALADWNRYGRELMNLDPLAFLRLERATTRAVALAEEPYMFDQTPCDWKAAGADGAVN